MQASLGLPGWSTVRPPHESTMQVALREAVCFALMLGLGEAFILADAVRLGATPLQLGVVVALPLFVGAGGPGLTLVALRRGMASQGISVVGASVQAYALALAATLEMLGMMSPLRLVAVACAYQLGGQVAVTASSTWLGDVVPAELRTAFFARRTRRVHLGTVTGLAVGGVVLQSCASQGVPALGFALVFGMAAAARGVGAHLLRGAPASPRTTPLRRRELRAVQAPGHRRQLRTLAVGAAALQLAVYLAAPFFTPHMLNGLGMSYLELMMATLAQGVGSALALPLWGRTIERHSAQRVYLVSLAVIAIVPLPWLWVGGALGAVACQVLAGIGWAAYEVGLLSLLLQLTEPRTRPHALAAAALGTGLGQLVGGLGASIIVEQLGFTSALHATFVLRLAVLVGMVLWLRSASLPPASHRGPRPWRLVGFRPHAGFALALRAGIGRRP